MSKRKASVSIKFEKLDEETHRYEITIKRGRKSSTNYCDISVGGTDTLEEEIVDAVRAARRHLGFQSAHHCVQKVG